MNFTPKSEAELQQSLLLEKGLYPFQVIDAKDEISKSGNEMVKLTLKIWAKDGSERTIFDYLLEAMAFKLRHFCMTTGLLDKYESGELKAIDCIGKCGKCDVVLQQGQPNPTGGYYPDKNNIKDYVISERPSMTMPLKENFIDDSIPF